MPVGRMVGGGFAPRVPGNSKLSATSGARPCQGTQTNFSAHFAQNSRDLGRILMVSRDEIGLAERTAMDCATARAPLARARGSLPRDPEKLRLLPLAQPLPEQRQQRLPIHGLRQKRVTASRQALFLVPTHRMRGRHASKRGFGFALPT